MAFRRLTTRPCGPNERRFLTLGGAASSCFSRGGATGKSRVCNGPASGRLSLQLGATGRAVPNRLRQSPLPGRRRRLDGAYQLHLRRSRSVADCSSI